MQNYDKSLDSYQKALKIRQSVLGEKNADTGKCYGGISLAYFFKEDYANARINIENSIAIFKDTLPADHPDIKTYSEFLTSVKQLEVRKT